MRFLVMILFFSGCGEMGSGGQPAFLETLKFLQQNGLPKIDALLPPLPAQFSFVQGVATNELGQPQIPNDLAALSSSASTAEFAAFLGDARALSAQGFAEAMRLEGQLRNMLSPVVGFLGESRLFASSVSVGGSGLEMYRLAEANEPSVNLFEVLEDKLTFAIDVGGVAGMPDYLLLSTKLTSPAISVAGLWKSPKKTLQTGFGFDIAISSPDDMEFGIALLPGTVKQLVGDWATSTCADDLLHFALTLSPAIGQEVTVNLNECPTAQNAVKSLSLSSKDGQLGIRGAFAQDFVNVGSSSLRGWLGKRQAFVMQAAASSNGVAAAAAVLRESQLGDKSAIDNFGIGQLIADYFLDKYWAPILSAANDGGFFGNPTNIAYWTCVNSLVSPLVKSEAAGAERLCNGQSLDVESLLETLIKAKATFVDYSIVPSSIRDTVGSIIDILTIRNGIFIDPQGALSYKKAPSDNFAKLATYRSSLGYAAVNDLGWQSSARLQLATVDSLPETPFGVASNLLKNFLQTNCESLLGNTQTNAKKSKNVGACSKND